MEQLDWSVFRLKVNIKVQPEVVYQAWATSEGLSTWFLRKAAFQDIHGRIKGETESAVEGDEYEWYWYGYPDSVTEKGKILEANGKDRFAFTFSMNCPVRIRIYTAFDQTILELIESELPTDEKTKYKHYLGDSKGWIFYLTNLKSVLEGGLDLRNKDEGLKNVITA